MTGHLCPGGCGRQGIPFERLACRWCWFRLPTAIRAAVTSAWANRRQTGGLARHSEAIKAAKAWWTDNPLPTAAHEPEGVVLTVPAPVDEVHHIPVDKLDAALRGAPKLENAESIVPPGGAPETRVWRWEDVLDRNEPEHDAAWWVDAHGAPWLRMGKRWPWSYALGGRGIWLRWDELLRQLGPVREATADERVKLHEAYLNRHRVGGS